MIPELNALAVLCKKYRIVIKFVTLDDLVAFSVAIDENTKAIFIESIGNPRYNVSPINEIAEVCE